jgi:lambda family phage portal protein
MNWWPWKKTAQRRGNVMSVRGFQAAQTDRLLAGWSFDGGFTSQEISAQLATIRARSREMSKNSPHYRRWLQMVATNVVGEGFALKSTPHDGLPGAARLDKGAARFIEYHWWRFCNYRDPQSGQTWCDASGRKTMAEMDRLNAKTWARDGEYFVQPIATNTNPYGLTFRVIRPDACDEKYMVGGETGGKTVRCGVEVDSATLRPTAYYMRTKPAFSTNTGPTGPLVRIPAADIIHGFTADDEDQPRGVPWGHAALMTHKMLEEYNRAEITAARDEACSVREYRPTDKTGNPDEFSDLTKEGNDAAAQTLLAPKEPGQAEILPYGYESKVTTPQHPNRELTAFKASLLRDVASGLGVEYANFANDWAGVSFSSVRAGTISERDMWIVLQNDMISQLKARQFLIWLRYFLTFDVSGGLPLTKFDKFSEHTFRGRRWTWVDPMKDMKSNEVMVAHGWKTNTQVAEDLGGDYEENIETIKEENKISKGVVNPNPQQQQQPAQPRPEAPEDEEDDDTPPVKPTKGSKP